MCVYPTPDPFGEQFIYMGISYGASAALPLLALEERLAAAVLIIGGVSVRAIAKKAGVSVGTIYTYFGSSWSS